MKTIKIKNNGEFSPEKTPIICISKTKYMDVHLAWKFENFNLSFASIEMNDGTFKDKASQFESLTELGNKIAEAWNEKFHLPLS